jgi:integrase
MMALCKRGKQYWLDVVVRGARYRESLNTTDWREATRLARERVEQLERQAKVPTANSRAYAALPVVPAIKAYAAERRAQVSKRMAEYWLENAKPLGRFFGEAKLRQITYGQLADYQNARTDAGISPKTINGEVSVLRQVLKHARLWHRFSDDYKPLRNYKPPVGQALTSDEQERLFAMAKTRPAWLYAFVATTLSFYCGMRACEIKALHWRDIEFDKTLLHVRRSKTPAGWRSPTLNATCLSALQYLHDQASALGYTEPPHFVFPWHGRDQKIDPTRGMTSWRTAWRSIRKAAGLGEVRFHDGRHTAITTLAEKGMPDWVIQAQVGHVAPEMMKTYSHIRREALNQAAGALEPTKPAPAPDPPPAIAQQPTPTRSESFATTVPEASPMNLSHIASRATSLRGRVINFPKKRTG